MARKSRSKTPPETALPLRSLRSLARKWALRFVGGVVALMVFGILLFWIVNPYVTPYMLSEWRRVGDMDHTWVPMEEIAPVMARSAVAAEDADFCLHWGLDISAIRLAMAQGANRGGSTISQQVVKNVYLWQDRSWLRKMLEAVMTPGVELVWSKHRILEVYLNVAEFDEGVFGVQAAALHYFGVDAADLTATQAARLAAILPAPKSRSASNPSAAVRSRASQIIDGAATIDADGRADCFQSSD